MSLVPSPDGFRLPGLGAAARPREASGRAEALRLGGTGEKQGVLHRPFRPKHASPSRVRVWSSDTYRQQTGLLPSCPKAGLPGFLQLCRWVDAADPSPDLLRSCRAWHVACCRAGAGRDVTAKCALSCGALAASTAFFLSVFSACGW